MSRPLHNLENSSEINTKIIGNNSLGETNKIKILKDIIRKILDYMKKKILKELILRLCLN